MRRLPVIRLSLLLGAALALWSCASAPPSPQDGLPPNKLTGMHNVWGPTMVAFNKNCFQCHSLTFIEYQGSLSGNTAWLAAQAQRGSVDGKLPRSVSYEDILAMVKFVSAHYGAYHIGDPKELARYNEMAEKGLIVDDPNPGAGKPMAPGSP